MLRTWFQIRSRGGRAAFPRREWRGENWARAVLLLAMPVWLALPAWGEDAAPLPGGFQDTSLDSFSYTSDAEAQGVWKPGERSAPVRHAEGEGGSWIEAALPFATDTQRARCVYDRAVRLDLSSAGVFLLDLAVDHPQAVGSLSLYFRSGAGWYAGSGRVAETGRQTLRFAKSQFRTEGSPGGWDQVDGIRIAFWRGKDVNATVRLFSLTARRHDIAIVVPSQKLHGAKPEFRTARETAERVAEFLDALGLGADCIEDDGIDESILAVHPLIIVPYHPFLEQRTTESLLVAMRRGSKGFFFYQVPKAIYDHLGVGDARYMAQHEEGEFAEIRFETAALPDLPNSLRQSSWNITDVRPRSDDARVIGWWHDRQGKAVEHAALTVSPRGAFFSHILLDGDAANKRMMLAAVLGYLRPELRETMVRAAVQRAVMIGHLDVVPEADKLAALEDWVSRLGPAGESARQALQAGKNLLAAARSAPPSQPRLALVQQARERLAAAYLTAQDSPPVEGRAYWNHSGLGAYPGDWERTAKELKTAGFNMILPNMLWGGLAHYPSDLLPRSSTYEQYGDQIDQCVRACHKHGLEVHVWKVNFNLSTAPKQFVAAMREAGRTQVDPDGNPIGWLCPSHPQNRQLELESMLEVATQYPVDGLHFDYIRYPGPNGCYCDGCRQRFQADTGLTVEHWPQDCYSGPLKERYRQWRCDQITALVAAVSREAKQLRPNLKISAAVFGDYPSCRDSVGQDWVQWIDAGYLDFVCPMDYTNDHARFISLVKDQRTLPRRRIPLYPGIGAWQMSSEDRVVGQIALARDLGADGFTIFNLQPDSVTGTLPAVAAGVGRTPAVPPHRKTAESSNHESSTRERSDHE